MKNTHDNFKTEYKQFKMIDNYIYLYHLDQFFVIPTFPDSLNDQQSVTYNSATPMSRTAPVYSYSHSGPRSLQITLDLHRDMMYQINHETSNATLEIDDDYVDSLIKGVQACALPSYASSQNMVDPPMVAVRFGEDIFIKGVVTGAVGVQYSLPILQNDKYAHVTLSFNVEEVEPFDAQQVVTQGSFRGIDTTLERNFWKA